MMTKCQTKNSPVHKKRSISLRAIHPRRCRDRTAQLMCRSSKLKSDEKCEREAVLHLFSKPKRVAVWSYIWVKWPTERQRTRFVLYRWRNNRCGVFLFFHFASVVIVKIITISEYLWGIPSSLRYSPIFRDHWIKCVVSSCDFPVLIRWPLFLLVKQSIGRDLLWGTVTSFKIAKSLWKWQIKPIFPLPP